MTLTIEAAEIYRERSKSSAMTESGEERITWKDGTNAEGERIKKREARRATANFYMA